jgi:tol-pal system protein YbgF
MMSDRSTRRRSIAVAVALATGLQVGGCAGVAEVTGTATQDDLMQLRADVTQLQLGLQRARADVERLSGTTDSRGREQLAQQQKQSEEIVRRLDALATTVAGLTSRMDEMSARIEAVSRRAAPPATPPRATTPPPIAGAPPVTPSPPSATPSAPPATPPSSASRSVTTATLQPQDVYQAAYIDYSKGSYMLAIAGFREFLRRYPEHDLADNAQYWVGEAHFSLSRNHANAGQADKATQELQLAVQEFRKVIANYPRGDKTPTALYKEAIALIELKQRDLALARLQYLVDNFPQAEETPLARERLTALKGE